jgi:hypothetical protein
MVDFHGNSVAMAKSHMRLFFKKLLVGRLLKKFAEEVNYSKKGATSCDSNDNHDDLLQEGTGGEGGALSNKDLKLNIDTIVVIVGKGTNSEGNNPILPAALKNFFQEEEGMRTEDIPLNPGRFEVSPVVEAIERKYGTAAITTVSVRLSENSTTVDDDDVFYRDIITPQVVISSNPHPPTSDSSTSKTVKLKEFPSELTQHLIKLVIESENLGVDKLIEKFLNSLSSLVDSGGNDYSSHSMSKSMVRQMIDQLLVKDTLNSSSSDRDDDDDDDDDDGKASAHERKASWRLRDEL